VVQSWQAVIAIVSNSVFHFIVLICRGSSSSLAGIRFTPWLEHISQLHVIVVIGGGWLSVLFVDALELLDGFGNPFNVT